MSSCLYNHPSCINDTLNKSNCNQDVHFYRDTCCLEINGHVYWIHYFGIDGSIVCK